MAQPAGPDLITVRADTSVTETARVMRDHDVQAVIVEKNQRLYGVATAKDITIRSTAEGRDPTNTPVSEVCNQLVSDDGKSEAPAGNLSRMRAAGQGVGIVSMGDPTVTEAIQLD